MCGRSARWRQIEALGFDSAWVGDHYAYPYAPASPLFEGWTSLAALATQTARVRVGMLVACATFRNPVLFTKEAVTLDHISGGGWSWGSARGTPHPNTR